ncbi:MULTISPECIES: class I SAM-dependent methyltransferase [Pyrobaculum]|uniref:Methyltransferase type 11 n=2 Tax=Pyrobaculum arsenaticum TaxID=121277 RepID=A4WJ89_PYRAR|nr:methyltransferase domain-containing protein [Pyrobaculum arsenaticum]ABP50456.1 Methyltransferase type 11 [Pyrobaculum arsenaticum DSM 13514]MCY0890448.1 methyltransferase domain-containing protein [Pyrobaculum arsenaticum]NYR14602.1 class I SAM-dependent methyltransferase [Pyrobaculum arsenaticum]
MLEVFRDRARDYDAWYERHPQLYRSELMAASTFNCRGGVEIGVGTGRFAAPLGIAAGVDPVREMLRLAPRELDLVEGVGEMLPLKDGAYPCALIVVTICFVQDPEALLREAARAAGRVVACIVPRESPWGRLYTELGRGGHPFYSRARFYTVREVVGMAKGLKPVRLVATLFAPPPGAGEEEPTEASIDEAERAGFACIEFKRA